MEFPTDKDIKHETPHYNIDNAIREAAQSFGLEARDNSPVPPFRLRWGSIDRKISIPTINRKTSDPRTLPQNRRPRTGENNSGGVRDQYQGAYQQ